MKFSVALVCFLAISGLALTRPNEEKIIKKMVSEIFHELRQNLMNRHQANVNARVGAYLPHDPTKPVTPHKNPRIPDDDPKPTPSPYPNPRIPDDIDPRVKPHPVVPDQPKPTPTPTPHHNPRIPDEDPRPTPTPTPRPNPRIPDEDPRPTPTPSPHHNPRIPDADNKVTPITPKPTPTPAPVKPVEPHHRYPLPIFD